MASKGSCLLIFHSLLGILILLGFSAANVDEEFESLATLVLEHSFGTGPDEVFTKRGTITVRSIKSGTAHISQDAEFSEEEKEQLTKLVANDGLYRVRVASKTSTQGPVAYVSSFVKACALYEAKLTDTITISMDLSGSVLGVSVSVPTPYCHGLKVSDRDLSAFKTTVEVVQTAVGPAPETQTYIQKMEQERAEQAKGQTQDNRSFFGKYWMYIIPVVIMLVFASNQDPNAQGGGGGGGGR